MEARGEQETEARESSKRSTKWQREHTKDTLELFPPKSGEAFQKNPRGCFESGNSQRTIDLFVHFGTIFDTK